MVLILRSHPVDYPIPHGRSRDTSIHCNLIHEISLRMVSIRQLLIIALEGHFLHFLLIFFVVFNHLAYFCSVIIKM